MNEKKFTFPTLPKERVTEILRMALILAAVAAAAALIVSCTYALTSSIEKANLKQDLYEAMNRVLPAERYEEVKLEDKQSTVTVYEAFNGNTLVGYCAETTAEGHDGEIRMVVGVSPEEKITNVEIISIEESRGFETKSKQVMFLSLFASKTGVLTAVKGEAKGDREISVVSGATVSSEAVCDGVNRAMAAVSQIVSRKAKEAGVI